MFTKRTDTIEQGRKRGLINTMSIEGTLGLSWACTSDEQELVCTGKGGAE